VFGVLTASTNPERRTAARATRANLSPVNTKRA
jgi:hypothetical protein